MRAWGTGATPHPAVCAGSGLQARGVSGAEARSTEAAFYSLSVSPVKKRTVSELPHPLLDSSEERVPDKEAIHSQEAKGTVLTEKAGFFPPVENLDPRERRRSTEPPEDWPSEEEIRRFWKLRQEIVGSEPAEVPESQRLPVELPPALKAVLRDKETRRPRPRPVFR